MFTKEEIQKFIDSVPDDSFFEFYQQTYSNGIKAISPDGDKLNVLDSLNLYREKNGIDY